MIKTFRHKGLRQLFETGRSRPEMPTGPLNRVADNSLAKKVLGWEPEVKFRDGLRATIDWYYSTRDRHQVAAILDHMLTERSHTDRASVEIKGV